MADTLTSNLRVAIHAFIGEQWRRISPTPRAEPGSYYRGYDNGIADVLRGVKSVLDRTPDEPPAIVARLENLAARSDDIARALHTMAQQLESTPSPPKATHLVHVDNLVALGADDVPTDPQWWKRVAVVDGPPPTKQAHCVDCSEPRVPGLIRCESHAASHTGETKGTLPDFSPIFGGAATVDPKPGECTCYECSSEIRRMTRMITCAICGNKRCPHATHHKHQCTNSNEPGQPGSRY